MTIAACALTVAAPAADLTLGNPRALLDRPGRFENPALAPAGDRVAFVVHEDGAENLYVASLAGGEPTRLTSFPPGTEVGTPAWSPGGAALVYASNQGESGFDLWRIDADGGNAQALTADSALDWMPAWSPDGQRIAFVSDRDGLDAVWTIAADGSDAVKVLDLAYEPAWSPDGQLLAVYAIRDEVDGIFLVPLSGDGEPRLVLGGARMPSFSPAGDRLVAVRTDADGGRLWTVGTTGGEATAVSPTLADLGWPRWGAGDTVVYEARNGGDKHVYVAALGGSGATAPVAEPAVPVAEPVTPVTPVTPAVPGSPALVALLRPAPGAMVRGQVAVEGRIDAQGGGRWQLEYGEGSNPGAWTVVQQGAGPVDGYLTMWDTSGLQGLYTLRLTTVTDAGETVVSSVPLNILGQYGVQWVEHNIPTRMITGKLYEATIQVRNTGVMTWRNDGRFAVYGSYQWLTEDGRVLVGEGLPAPLPGNVAPGETVTLKAPILAPATAGRYTLRYDLRQGGQVWFAEQGVVPLTLPTEVVYEYAAELVVGTTPDVMLPGQIYTVEALVTNSGTVPWTGLDAGADAAGRAVMLIGRWRNADGGVVETTPIPTAVPETVDPGETAVVPARVQAPGVGGDYTLFFELMDPNGGVTLFSPGAQHGAQVVVAAPYGVEYLDHKTPGRMFPGEIYVVSLRARNTGSLRWRAEGPNAIRVSYHWEDDQGRRVEAAQIQTELPYDVLAGQTAALMARVQTPNEPGEYRIVWDLYQESGRRFGELGNRPLVVPVMVAAPTHSVRWTQLSHPVEMVVDTVYTVDMRLTNTGAMTWPADGEQAVSVGYHWVTESGEELPVLPLFTSLPAPVEKGETVRMTARVKAPSDPGAYLLRWDLYQEGYGFFSGRGASTLDVPVDVERIYGARYVSHNTPNRLLAGQRYTVSLKVANTGNIPWELGGPAPVLLGYHWLNAAGEEVTAAPTMLTPLPETVQPGEAVDVVAELVAPSEPGQYTLVWDLSFAEAFWFSEKGIQPLRVPVVVE